jgi:hypothetical protein
MIQQLRLSRVVIITSEWQLTSQVSGTISCRLPSLRSVFQPAFIASIWGVIRIRKYTLIEGLISIISALVEAGIALISTLVEFIAGFFVAAGETLTLIDLFTLLFVVFFEILFWLFLWLVELVISLVKWRKPQRVKKPVLWRPKPKVKGSKDAM